METNRSDFCLREVKAVFGEVDGFKDLGGNANVVKVMFKDMQQGV